MRDKSPVNSKSETGVLVPNCWATFPVVNVEKPWSSQLKTRETDEPEFHRSSKVQFISFLYYFTHPYFATALVCVCCTRQVSGCGTLYGCMGPRCLRWGERAKILVVCQIFCTKYFVCKFLHFSASNLNWLHVVESPSDLFYSLGLEVNENCPGSIRNKATNS